jgi:hypothetical protein
MQATPSMDEAIVNQRMKVYMLHRQAQRNCLFCVALNQCCCCFRKPQQNTPQQFAQTPRVTPAQNPPIERPNEMCVYRVCLLFSCVMKSFQSTPTTHRTTTATTTTFHAIRRWYTIHIPRATNGVHTASGNMVCAVLLSIR